MSKQHRKIIHIDMDCFYAAIEMRDNPALVGKPIAVGGASDHRGVLCTCNYEARKYGLRSAMATALAEKKCPDLILLPVNMSKYRAVSEQIQGIFKSYTDQIEPLSLDEAFLDVTESPHCQGSATWIAKEIRQRIFDQTGLTASAGVAPNKLLAKIASDWNKPNGQFVIAPANIDEFMKDLSMQKIFGVGKVTAEKLSRLGVTTCHDLQQFSRVELTEKFGKHGTSLFDSCRGIDERKVDPNRIRKSVSTETTFDTDINSLPQLEIMLQQLFEDLRSRLQNIKIARSINCS